MNFCYFQISLSFEINLAKQAHYEIYATFLSEGFTLCLIYVLCL